MKLKDYILRQGEVLAADILSAIQERKQPGHRLRIQDLEGVVASLQVLARHSFFARRALQPRKKKP